jgi:ubiquitin carboxyl-terminal hydrolase 5/13
MFDGIDLSGIQIPGSHALVAKDECAYSFHTPLDAGGLYIDLVTLYGVSPKWLRTHARKTGHRLFAHVQTTLHFKPVVEAPRPSRKSEPPCSASALTAALILMLPI